jgi:hypothetical protein
VVKPRAVSNTALTTNFSNEDASVSLNMPRSNEGYVWEALGQTFELEEYGFTGEVS